MNHLPEHISLLLKVVHAAKGEQKTCYHLKGSSESQDGAGLVLVSHDYSLIVCFLSLGCSVRSIRSHFF